MKEFFIEMRWEGNIKFRLFNNAFIINIKLDHNLSDKISRSYWFPLILKYNLSNQERLTTVKLIR